MHLGKLLRWAGWRPALPWDCRHFVHSLPGGASLFIMQRMKRLLLIPILFVLAAVGSISAEAEEQQAAKTKAAKLGELFETIARMDSAIFDAFNAHDVERIMAFFTEDLEFYHDTGGLTNYVQNKEAFKKMFGATPDIRRDLIKVSLEVYPIKDYGAMEFGQHRFCHKENGKDDCGTFGFAMVWRKTGDSWKISRVLSWGHQPSH
jgi:ketosteroid isomerase-like protein